MKILVILCLSLLLAGCASLSEKECKRGDWSAIGQKDGERGLSLSRLESHQKACGEYGINPDKVSYERGHGAGAKIYCDRTGLEHGKKGELKKRPRMCRGVKSYDLSLNNGFKEFCRERGIEAGRRANKKSGDRRCHTKKDYMAGFKEGIRDYCSEDNAFNLGKKADSHQGHQCPKDLKYTFNKSYRSGLEQYCKRLNGFSIARDGGEYRPSKCPSSLRSDFEMAYKKGIEYKSLVEQMSSLDTKVSELTAKIEDEKTSKDLREYLVKERSDKKSKKEALNVRKIKIEGFLGL